MLTLTFVSILYASKCEFCKGMWTVNGKVLKLQFQTEECEKFDDCTDLEC